jgi:acyl carrier protein
LHPHDTIVYLVVNVMFQERRVAMSVKLTIMEQMVQVAREHGKALAPLKDDLHLAESGLDSLGFAVLVARLEDQLGFDPFAAASEAFFPATLGEFVKVYENGAH